MGKKKETTKQFADRISLEIGRDKAHLEMTRAFLALWGEMCKHLDINVTEVLLLEMEALVVQKAKLDWGNKTNVIFNRDMRTAIIESEHNRREWGCKN